MTKYNLTAAVIGTGYIGIQHLEALKTLVSEVVVCNADQEKGKAVAENTVADSMAIMKKCSKKKGLILSISAYPPIFTEKLPYAHSKTALMYCAKSRLLRHLTKHTR